MVGVAEVSGVLSWMVLWGGVLEEENGVLGLGIPGKMAGGAFRVAMVRFGRVVLYSREK